MYVKCNYGTGKSESGGSFPVWWSDGGSGVLSGPHKHPSGKWDRDSRQNADGKRTARFPGASPGEAWRCEHGPGEEGLFYGNAEAGYRKLKEAQPVLSGPAWCIPVRAGNGEL